MPMSWTASGAHGETWCSPRLQHSSGGRRYARRSRISRMGPTCSAVLTCVVAMPLQNAAAAGTPGSMLLNALGIGNEPEPVLFPRKALNQVFAVLLMRSAYDAVDDLDFIPMVSGQRRLMPQMQSTAHKYPIRCAYAHCSTCTLAWYVLAIHVHQPFVQVFRTGPCYACCGC